VTTIEVTNAGTVYRIHAHDAGYGVTYLALETGWGSGYGEWIRLNETEIHWSYLAEKMPIMAQREGDKPGWVKAFAAAGIEVFG
jgi:hypothetical protein